MSGMSEAEKNGRKAEMDAWRALKGLNGIFSRKGYPLHNLFLPTKGGATTELDLAFVTRQGVFAVECKNLSGKFHGRESDREWRNVKVWGRDRTVEERKLYNPIMQNRTHIDSLKRLLGDGVPVHSVILFSDNADWSDLEVSDSVLLLSLGEVGKKIPERMKSLPKVLSAKEARKAWRMLKPLGKAGRRKAKEHLELVRKIEEHPDLCPLCGKKLIEKSARNADGSTRRFLGCTGWPGCKYTRNI